MSQVIATEHTRESILNAIQEHLIAMLGNSVAEHFTLETDLRGGAPLHLDSIDEIELLMNLEREFDIDISEAEWKTLTTVSDVVEFIATRLKV